MTELKFKNIPRLKEVLERADKLGLINNSYSRMTCSMDIEAADCDLDIDKLLDFEDFDFTHDICGIARHIDRNTGKLKDCFSPRCEQTKNLPDES